MSKQTVNQNYIIMKKLFYFAAIIFAAMFISCRKEYDDSAIWNEFDKVYDQIEELKEVCRQMNTNISSLQTLVNALNQKEYITNIAPITKNGAEIGYSITFTSGKTITIYHGEDGKDGQDGADGKDGINGTNGADGKDGADGTYFPRYPYPDRRCDGYDQHCKEKH